MKHYKYLILLIISASFLMSQVGQVPNKKGYPSPINSKKKAVIKAGENDDLKSELIDLENSFKDQHASIKSGYKERISALKEQQKAEVQELKKNYNKRRAAIYKKYGVKPPKKDSQSNDNSDTYQAPNKKTTTGKNKKLIRK